MASGTGAVAIGSNAKVGMNGGVAIGDTAAASQDAVALGHDAKAQSTNSIAIGAQSSAAANGTSLGFNAKSASNTMALGANAVAIGNNSVALGNGSVAVDSNVVSVGGTGAERRIVNVAAGVGDADAVNVGQLKTTGLVGDDGSGNLTSLAVTYDNAAKGTITLGGDPATGTQIKNVANGTDANDAVNVSQLDALQASTGDQITTATRYFKANGLNDGTDDASATGTRAVAIGANANAVSGNSVALGANALSSGTASLALGAGASASAMNSVALGANSIANQIGVVSVGQAGAERRIVNVGDARDETDAVNLRTLEEKIGAGSTATLNQVDAQVAKIKSTLDAMPQTAAASDYFVADGAGDGSDVPTVTAGDGGLAAGAGASVSGIGGVAVGGAAKATGTQATALGSDAQALSGSATAIGGGATANGSSSVAIGSGAVTAAGANFATAIGSLANAAGGSAVAIGNGATAARQSLAIGTNSGATGANSVAMGFNAKSTADNSVALGVGSQADRVNSVSVGTAGGERQITNVAAGTADTDAVNVKQLKDVGLVGTDPGTGDLTSLAVAYDDTSKGLITLGGDPATGTTITNVAAGEVSATSKDAVNGSQLFGVSKSVADNLGGRSTVNPDGTISAPTYDLADASGDGRTDYHNVGDALTNLDGRVTGNTTNITNLLDGKAGLVQQANASAELTVGKDTGGTSVNFADANGNQRTLTNVAAGVNGTDAVNVQQLKDVGLVGTDPGTGDLTSLAVAYDDTSKGMITLGGDPATGTQIKNVADGVDRRDAVNLGQLQDAGLVAPIDPTNPGAGLASLAVTYGTNADGSANFDEVALKGGANGTKLSNVADGSLSATSKDAVNGSQLFGVSKSVADNLGGRSTVNPDGTISAPTYDLADASGDGRTDYHNVGDALTNLDGRVTGNTTNITNLLDGKAGLVQQANANAELTVGKDTGGTSVNFADANGNQRTLTNVAAGVNGTDAVNVQQLKDAGLVGTDPGTGDLTSLAVAYDDTSKGTITLGGDPATGTQIKNVANGTDANDAVNVSQLDALQASTGDQITTATRYFKANGLNDGTDDASATGSRAVAIGAKANAVSGNSVALGANASASGTSSLALGTGASASSMNSVALGANSVANQVGVVSVGQAGAERRIVNVGDAQSGTDAVNLRTLDAKLTSSSTATLNQVNDQVAEIKSTLDAMPQTAAASDYFVADGAGDGSDVPTTAAGLGGLAAGTGATSSGIGGVAVGAAAQATGTQATALGSDAQALNGNATAIGGGAIANGSSSVAIGSGAVTTAGANFATAIGSLASATGASAVAIGNGANAASQGLAIGTNAGATGNNATAMGYNALASAGNSVALGANSQANRVNSVSVGTVGSERQITNVAAGTAGTDAVNVDQLKDYVAQNPGGPGNPLAVAYDDATKGLITLSGDPATGTTITNVAAGDVSATSKDAVNGAQLHGVSQSVAASLGGGSTVDANGNVTAPTYSLADPTDVSQKADYHDVGAALGNLDGRVVTNTNNITVIQNQLADSGLVDPVTGQSFAAVTYDNKNGATDYNSVTLGGGKSTGPVTLKNVADGVDAHDAVNVSQLQNAGLVAPVDPTNPGSGLTSLAVTYGKNANGTANFDEIALKGAAGTTISNVKAGAVNATSTEAVNGAQLHGVSQSVAASLGGGSTVDANGNVTSPTYVVNKQTFNNVGDAITNISDSLSDGSIGLVQQDATTRDITVAKDTDGTTVDFTGTAGDRVLTGVAAGAVSAASKDAVNGSQLYGVADSVATTLGGGTTVDADGKLANSAFQVNGQQYKTVEQAIQAAAAYGATDSLAVRYDLNADGTPNYGSVTLGGTAAAPVVLTNVADGVNRSDAVNFGQLTDRFDSLDGRVGALEQLPPGNGGGGGSGDNPYFAGTGDASSTAANAGNGTGNTAAGSGATIGTGANNATVIGSGANATKDNGVAIGSGSKSGAEGAVAIGQGASATGSNSVALGAGSVASDNDTVSIGSLGNERTLSNVKDGFNASDAATKGQLDRAVGGLQGQINDVSKNAYSGIAAATALTMIPGVDPGKTLSFGVGGATYKGYQAVAFGGEARITQNLKMKAGVGLSSGGNTVGVGAAYQW
ncbi:YadA-like family protein [Burkholderia sp. BE12]|uniref:YadA-like family protein n=1 Tax=Burkholderia sp. BE12 TaxID=2082394 RepID=UPI001F4787A9|nr:YadA-like family protein [Burkholderia sp. BE12]